MRAVALKRVVHIVAGQSPPSGEVDDFNGFGLRFLQGNAEFGQSHPVARYQCETPPKRARAGDILLSVRAPVGALNIADRDYGIGRGLAAIRPAGIDSRFAWWALHARVDRLRASATGSTFEAITAEDIGSLMVQLPPPSDQRRIADFLDAETARIDALIEKKRRMVELLTDRRTAAIDQLLDMPRRARLRRLTARLTSGPRGWAQHASQDGSVFLRISNLSRTSIELDLSRCVYVTPPHDAKASRTRVQAGDVLLSITADVGSVGLARSRHEGAYVSQHIALISPEECSGEWLAYALSTSSAQQQLNAARYGGTKTQLALEDVADVIVPIPGSRSTEEHVLERVRRANAAIDAIRDRLDDQVTLLRERRQALITAAVTGQLDVVAAAA